MNTSNETNLKKLLLSLGDAQVVTASYLLAHGYSYENLKGYVRSGYLHSLGRGAYCRAGATPSVEAAVTAMAEQLAIPVHIGGRSALSKSGYVHFVSVSDSPTILFVSRGVRMPAWFLRHYDGRFSLVRTNFINSDAGVEDKDGCPVSTPERAILEFLHDVPCWQSLSEAYQLLEMMQTLRPKRLTELLSACSSVKVKRLFFLLADDLNLPWWHRVEKDVIDLGSGCRVIDKGGSFRPKYNLVVKPWREI